VLTGVHLGAFGLKIKGTLVWPTFCAGSSRSRGSTDSPGGIEPMHFDREILEVAAGSPVFAGISIFSAERQ
jgi:hypothetical protein